MTTLTISGKTRDMFWAVLHEDSKILAEMDGYVPDWMPGEHFGDYVKLDIDAETGQILNWKPVTAKDFK